MSNYYFLSQLTGRDAHLRAGDADRERIAERLRHGHTEGRLDMTEFQERLEHCYQARTMGDLDDLVRDLPRQSERPDHRWFGWAALWHWPLGPLVPVLLVLLVISAAFGHHHVGWLCLPIVFLFWKMSWWRRRRWYTGPR
jgi:hypothetical protein